MKLVTATDVWYTQQQKTLDEIAEKLGVVAYRPSYWKQQKRRGYITPEEYQQLAEEFIGARPVKNKEDETNGKDP